MSSLALKETIIITTFNYLKHKLIKNNVFSFKALTRIVSINKNHFIIKTLVSASRSS